MEIGVIDYGLGNLRSVAGAIQKIGHVAVVSSKREDLMRAKKLILPGVGAFGDGMKNLRALGLVEILNEEVLEKRKPFLGICLGAQLLAKESFEFGHHQGLGWIEASVKRIDPLDAELRVPHVGWNSLHKRKASFLFEEIPDDALMYYVHSFHIECQNAEDVLATCEYGVSLCSVISRDNIYATQFHPEKSQLHGLKLLSNFVEKA